MPFPPPTEVTCMVIVLTVQRISANSLFFLLEIKIEYRQNFLFFGGGGELECFRGIIHPLVPSRQNPDQGNECMVKTTKLSLASSVITMSTTSE